MSANISKCIMRSSTETVEISGMVLIINILITSNKRLLALPEGAY